MGNSPDVRVRLSAEGQLEVINAFKKIQAEATKTGTVGAKGLSALSSAASTLARFLPSLTFGAAIAGATVLAKRALDTGENFAKLSQKTGVSAETLSAWSHAANISETDIEALAKGLARLSKNMGAAAQGGDEQVRAFRRVGISQKELQSGTITTDQAVLRISKHISEQADGWQKAALAQQFFGRSGADLLPFLNQGPEGLKRLREEAERLGLVWSTETAQAADQFNDNLRRLRATVEGFVNKEMAALLPVIIEITEKWLAFTGGLGQGDSLLKNAAINMLTFGAAARFALKSLTATTLLGPAGLILSLTKFRNELKGELAAIAATVLEAEQKAAKVASQKPKTGDEPPLRDKAAETRVLNALKQFNEAKLALERGRLDNELALLKGHNAVAEAEDARRFKEGLTAVEDFFAGRRATIEQEGAKEIAVLARQVGEIGKQIAEVAKRPFAEHEQRKAREAELTKLITERDKAETAIEVKRLEIQGKLVALAGEQFETVRKTNTEQLRAEAEILNAQGQRFAAARVELDAQIAALERLKGESDTGFAARQRALTEAGEARIQFEQLQAQARAVFADIESARISIEALVARGIITQAQGQAQVAAIELERLPTLEAIGAEMGEIAATTKDPEQITSVNELGDAVVRLGAEADLAGQRVAELRATLEQVIASDISNFFARGIDDAKSFGDAMRGLALSVVQSLRQIVSQMLATLIVTRLLRGVIGAISGGLGSIAPTGGGGGGGVGFGFASGGFVRGPGTGTSDSIPAYLSRGEYVIPARVVAQFGVDFFDDLRELQRPLRPLGRVRGYAGGGIVEGPPGRAGSRATLDVGLDDALFAKRLETNGEFEKVVVRMIGRNRRAVKGLLR